MTKPSILLLLVVFSFSFPLFAAEEYPEAPDKPTTLTELEDLATKKSWGELQLHLDEVAPADRGARWEGLVEKAATGRLKEMDSQSEGAADSFALDLETKFPLLLKKPAYMETRSAVALKAFERCYSNYRMTDECTDRIVNFAQAPPRSPEFAWQAAQLIVKQHKNASDAMPLMALAMTEGAEATICRSEAFSKSALAALETGKAVDRGLATDLIQKQCWVSMQPAFEKALHKDRNPAFLDVACPIAKGKGSAPAQCQGHYGDAASPAAASSKE